MRKTNKKGGFFEFFKGKKKSNKNKSKKNNNKTNYKKAHIGLDDGCSENHRGMNLPLNNKMCKCYCLEKKGKQISKHHMGDTYNHCFSTNTRTKNKKKCISSKYIWSSNKKPFSSKKKCGQTKSCWGK